MIIKKGAKVVVRHERLGRFTAEALKTFNPARTEFYPLKLAQQSLIGIVKFWQQGDPISPKAERCAIIRIN